MEGRERAYLTQFGLSQVFENKDIYPSYPKIYPSYLDYPTGVLVNLLLESVILAWLSGYLENITYPGYSG